MLKILCAYTSGGVKKSDIRFIGLLFNKIHKRVFFRKETRLSQTTSPVSSTKPTEAVSRRNRRSGVIIREREKNPRARTRTEYKLETFQSTPETALSRPTLFSNTRSPRYL